MSLSLAQRLIEQILQPYDACAVALTDGRILQVKSQSPTDHGTLPAALGIATKYFPLTEGDSIILNDPYSGGGTLNQITFITCLYNGRGNNPGLLLACRQTIEDNFSLVDHLDKEGLRIPPTPIRAKGKINQAIVDAIASHPMSIKNFRQIFEQTIRQLELTESKVQKYFQQIDPSFDFSVFNKRLEQSHHKCLNAISEFPYGESKSELTLDTGETLKLRIEVSSKEIKLDFSGTSAGKNTFLSDHATYGICYYSLSHHFGFQNLSDSGGFSILQVTKPIESFLTAKFPQPVYKGMKEATSALLTVIEAALLKLHSKSHRAQTNFSEALATFVFMDLPKLIFHLPAGSGAQEESEGTSAIFTSTPTYRFSIQDVETNYPLKVLKIEPRTSLGGKGRINGGRGLTIQLEALADGEILWSGDNHLQTIKPLKNQSTMDQAEFQLIRNSKSAKLESSGQLKIHKGDIIILASGTGAGLI